MWTDEVLNRSVDNTPVGTGCLGLQGLFDAAGTGRIDLSNYPLPIC